MSTDRPPAGAVDELLLTGSDVPGTSSVVTDPVSVVPPETQAAIKTASTIIMVIARRFTADLLVVVTPPA
jgi:hypothetical protein